jgi:Aerotolerance regulator N-terminal
MNWISLSVAPVAGFSALAAGLALWLYLRQPRAARLRVSTLRFWESAPSGSASARRRRLREPWALLAQILFLLFVIAALGDPRWGSASEGRSVAIVLDGGAWSQMRSANGVSWLDEVRAEAQNLLQGLPSDDRILVLRADSSGSPLVPFTRDRSTVRLALANLQSSSLVGDIPRALAQGRDALRTTSALSPKALRGLLVYIGPGLMDERQASALAEFRQALSHGAPAGTAAAPDAQSNAVAPEFLVRLVGNASPPQNIGITQIALKRSTGAPYEWAVMTQMKNYNDAPAKITLSLSLGGRVFREEHISLAPGATQSASDNFTSFSGGLLQAEVAPSDELAADNRATIALPSSHPVSVAVVASRTAFVAKMRAVLSANPYVKTAFVHPGVTPPPSDVVLYDGAVPLGADEPATISFLSEPVGAAGHRVRLGNWNSGHPVTRWIQSRDVTVRPAQAIQPEAGDVVLASSSDAPPAPLILAREADGRRSVVVDFDPLDSNFTEEQAFPLLMAASIEWMTHPIAEQGEFLTAGSVDLPFNLSRIVAPSGRDVLFASEDSGAHFFAAESGLYRVTAAGQSLEVPINVPLLPTIRMAPTPAEAAPLAHQPIPITQQELWRWLVALALIALWLEWRVFYFRREKPHEATARPAPSDTSLHIDLRESARQAENAKPAARS